MPVVYIEGLLQIQGLNLESQEQLTKLENEIKKTILMVAWASNPDGLCAESDVDFETDMIAGNFAPN